MTPEIKVQHINKTIDEIASRLTELIAIEREIRQKLFTSGLDAMEKKSRRRIGKLIRMRSSIHECVVNQYDIK